MRHSPLRTRIEQISMMIALVLVLSVNTLANLVPFNGINTGDVANQFDIFFFPANYVFSIWGLIYIGWIALVVFHLVWPSQHNLLYRGLRLPFIIGALANSAWIILWHEGAFLGTTIAMLVLLATLIIMMHRIIQYRKMVHLETKAHWMITAPTSIYLAWVSVATIANVTIVFKLFEWNQWGITEQWWAVVMTIIAGGLASVMVLRHHDINFALVIIWALTGILIRYPSEVLIATASITMSSVVGCVVLSHYLRHSHEIHNMPHTDNAHPKHHHTS